MAERRPTNQERRFRRLEEDAPDADEERGILELFERDEAPRDEDAPLARDDDPDE